MPGRAVDRGERVQRYRPQQLIRRDRHPAAAARCRTGPLPKQKNNMTITDPPARSQPGRRKARRFAGSLAVGAVVAGGLVAWEDLHNHAALAAAAAGPQPKGVHETAGFILATG